MVVSTLEAKQVDKLIGDRIRKARMFANMSQAQLESLLNTKRDTVSRWETGTNGVSAYRIALIAEITGQPLRFFYGEEGTTNPTQGQLNFKPGRGSDDPQRLKSSEAHLEDGEPGGYRTHDTLIKSIDLQIPNLSRISS